MQCSDRGTLFALFFGALTLTALQQANRSFLARLFQGPVLRTFGKYSYGLYVYHGVLEPHEVLHTEDRLGALLGNHSAGIAAQTVIGVTLSLIISVISYDLFEKRFLELKRYFESRPAAVPAAPAVAAVEQVSDVTG